MIHRIHGLVAFSCDSCSDETLETEEKDGRLAITRAQAQNWQCVMFKGEWQHLCPSCSKDI